MKYSKKSNLKHTLYKTKKLQTNNKNEMQSSVWQFQKHTAICSDTFFTSQFFNFDHQSSQMEDFDISKQYLKSQLSQKSCIVRQIYQQHFLKALQVHYKFCLINSLLDWRKMNQKQKRKEKLNPKNMTKVLLKVFYVLSKKMRSKTEKAFVKMVNFTKENDMKNYETPLVKGVKKLSESLESLNCKYFYSHPIVSQELMKLCFEEIMIFCKAFQNRQKISRMIDLLQQMSRHFSLQQFEWKLASYQKLQEKLEIFIGTLSLMVNPIKRVFIQKFKERQLINDFILNELNDESIEIIEPSIQKEQSTLFTEKQLKTENLETCLQKLIFDPKEIEYCPMEQGLGLKKVSLQGKEYNFTESNKDEVIEVEALIDFKNSLTFSKELKRKSSSSLEKKNKLKFKTVTSGTPKKQTPKENYIEKNLEPKCNKKNEQDYKEKDKSQQKCAVDFHERNFNLDSLVLKSKTLKLNMVFQNSLNFATKLSRNITINQKINHIVPIRPHELSTSYPDYFDFYSFANVPLEKLKDNRFSITSNEQTKKGFKIFKTIKSGKSFSNLEEIPNGASICQSFKNSYLKIPLKFTENSTSKDLIIDAVASQNPQIQKRKSQIQIKSDRENLKPAYNFSQLGSQRVINFKSLQRAASNSSLYDLKNQYRFPITSKSNKNIEILQNNVPNKRANQFYSEYESNPYQSNNERNYKQSKALEKPSSSTSKYESLTFKTNRPMKKVKSVEKEINFKAIQGKKERKGEKNMKEPSKIKRQKEAKSEFIDTREQLLGQYYKMDNMTLQSIRSGKSVLQKSQTKNLGLKVINGKK